MADQRLDELTENTAPADADLLYQVDASDTTDSAQGTSKKLTFANLKTWLQTAFNSVYAAASHTHTASDIDSEASTDGYVLTSDGAGNAAWEAVAGGAGALGDLSDVTLTSPASDEVLSYNGSAWVNAAASGGGSSSAERMVLLDTQTASADASLVFTVPSGYKNIWFEGELKSNNASSQDELNLFVNNLLTDASYQGEADGSSRSHPFCSYIHGSTGYSHESTFEVKLQKYDRTGYHTWTSRYYVQRESGFQFTQGGGAGTIVSEGPVTQVTLSPEYGTNITGEVRMYGEKDLTIEDSATITTRVNVPVVQNAADFTIDLTDYQDGDRLYLKVKAQSAKVDTNENFVMQANGDTTASNYESSYIYGSGSVAGNNNTDDLIGSIPAANSDADDPGYLVIELDDYASTTDHKRAIARSGMGRGADEWQWNLTWRWKNTAAITSIVLAADGGSNLTGSVEAYIEKQGVIASNPGWVELSQAEYDALTPDPDTIYLITS